MGVPKNIHAVLPPDNTEVVAAPEPIVLPQYVHRDPVVSFGGGEAVYRDPITGAVVSRQAAPDPTKEWEDLLRSQGIEPGPATRAPELLSGDEFEQARARIRSQGGAAYRPSTSPSMPAETPSAAREYAPPPGASAKRPLSLPSGVGTAAASGVDPTSGRRWTKGFGKRRFVDDGSEAVIPALDRVGKAAPALPTASGQPYELQRRLSEVEWKFPEGLRTKAYTINDLNPRPSTAGDGSLFITNPITGVGIRLEPGRNPKEYLAAVNSMAQAKAHAIADVMRGFEAETASRNRLAEMLGIDPSQLEGLTDQDAGTAMKYLGAENQRGEALQQRRDLDAEELAAMREGANAIDPELAGQLGRVGQPDAFGKMFGIGLDIRQRREAQDRADAKLADTEARNSAIGDVLAELTAMDPREAYPNAVRRIMEAGGTPTAARAAAAELAQRANDANRLDMQARGERFKAQQDELHQQQAEQKARHAEFSDNVLKPLRELISKRPTKSRRDEKLKETFTEPDYEKRSEQLAGGLQSVIGYLDAQGIDVGTAFGGDNDGISALARLRNGDSVTNEEMEHLLRVIHQATLGAANG